MLKLLVILLIELAPPVLFGLCIRISTPEILKWKIAAWRWLAASVAAFSIAILADWLAFHAAAGLAIAIGIFSVIRGLVSSATAWELFRQARDLQIAQLKQLEIPHRLATPDEP